MAGTWELERQTSTVSSLDSSPLNPGLGVAFPHLNSQLLGKIDLFLMAN